MANITVGTLRVLLSANTAEFDAAMARAQESAKVMTRSLEEVGRGATQLGSALTKTITLPLAAMAGASIKAAMDFESSFANVAKTVDGVSDRTGTLTAEGQKLAQTFRNLAKEIPATTDELNAIAALGGQMGVPIDQLEHFTRNVAALGVAVDGISTEEAAAGLAQIGNISGKGTTQIAEMASSLVHLGNSSNATEGNILEFTKRLMGAGHAVGMTVPEVMAIGTAMANVGINAEAGGTAMSMMISKMSKAVSTGGASLKAFDEIVAHSGKSFKELWSESPVQAVNAVVQGLSKAKESGQDLNIVVGQIGATNIRTADTMKRLAGAGTGVADSLVTANEGWATSNKHLEEAEKKYATTANQIKLLWNQIKDVGITIGNAMLPAIKSATSAVSGMMPIVDSLAKGFAALPGPIQAVVVGSLALVAAAGPLIWLFGQLVLSAAAVTGAFTATGVATKLSLLPNLNALAVSVKGFTFASMMQGAKSLGVSMVALATTVKGVSFASLASSASAAGAMIATMGRAALAAAPHLVAIGVAILSVQKIVEAATHAWKLYGERQERASMASNEAARQQAMLAEATKLAGRTITDYKEAVAIVNAELRRKMDAEVAAAAATATATAKTGEAAAAASGYAAELAEARKVMAGFSAEQRANIVAGDQMGASNKKIAESLKLTGDKATHAETAVKLYLDSLKSTGKTAAEVAEGPFKKLQNQLIQLDAQFKAAKSEGPAAYAMALEELGDAALAAARKAQMLGKPISIEIAFAANTQLFSAWSSLFEKLWTDAAGGQQQALDAMTAQLHAHTKRRVEAILEAVKAESEARRNLDKGAEEAELHGMEVAIKLAERRGASARELFELQKNLSARQLDIAIAHAQREFMAKTSSLDKTTEAGRRAYAAMERAHQQSVANMVANWKAGIDQQVAALPTLRQSLANVLDGIPQLLIAAFTGGGGIAGAMKALGVQLAEAVTEPVMSRLNELQARAIKTGQGLAAALGGALGGGTGATIGGITAGLGGAVLATTALGKAAATSMAAALGLGAATMGIGAAAVGVFMLAKHFFGVSKEVKQAREELDKFTGKLEKFATEAQRAEADGEAWALSLIMTRDALIDIGKAAGEADVMAQRLVKDLLNTDDPRRSAAAANAIRDIVNAAAEAKKAAGDLFTDIVDWAGQHGGVPEAMGATIQKFVDLGLLTKEQVAALQGLGNADALNLQKMQTSIDLFKGRVDSLGVAFKQQRLDETAMKYANALDYMFKHGADVGGVLMDAREELSELAQAAKRDGLILAGNLQPWMEHLAEAGLLTDENGEKMKDLSGIKFGPAMKSEAEIAAEGWEKILDRIDELIAKLTGPAISAMTNFASTAVGVMSRVADGVNDVIQMNSPTGLEGIVYYAKLAGSALETLGVKGHAAIGDLAESLKGIADTELGVMVRVQKPSDRELRDMRERVDDQTIAIKVDDSELLTAQRHLRELSEVDDFDIAVNDTALVDGFERVGGAVALLTEAIGRGLSGAAADAARGINHHLRATWGALDETANRVNSIIQMHSPTGLEGIVHYAKLAGQALGDLGVQGYDAIADLAESLKGVSDITLGGAFDVIGKRPEPVSDERYSLPGEPIGRLADAIEKMPRWPEAPTMPILPRIGDGYTLPGEAIGRLESSVTKEHTTIINNHNIGVVQQQPGEDEDSLIRRIRQEFPRDVAGNLDGLGVGLREALDLA